MQRALIALRGVFYATCFTALWTGLALLARSFDDDLPVTLPAAIRPFGAAIAVAGAALGIWCLATFIGRGRGTPAPFDPPRVFVASGPYRVVRNPMYIGGVGVVMGAGLIVGSPSILLLGGVGAILAHIFIVRHEEPALAERFGESYARYRETTGRWVPRAADPARPRVRAATPDDAVAIAGVHVRGWQRVYRGVVPDTYLDALDPARRAAMWTDVIAGRPDDVAVCERGSRVVGFAAVGVSRDDDASPETGELMAIYVDPRSWRCGVGTALMAWIDASARAQRWRTLTLWVLEENPGARAFYERVGFARDGRTKTVAFGGHEVVEVRYARPCGEPPRADTRDRGAQA